MAEEEDPELLAKQAAKKRQAEYKKVAKELKAKKPDAKLEAMERCGADYQFITEVRLPASRVSTYGFSNLCPPTAGAGRMPRSSCGKFGAEEKEWTDY